MDKLTEIFFGDNNFCDYFSYAVIAYGIVCLACWGTQFVDMVAQIVRWVV